MLRKNYQGTHNLSFHFLSGLIIGVIVSLQSLPVFSQDLDPRAYARVPLKTTTLITGFSYSQGGVVTDPTLPVKNIDAKVEAVSAGISRSFKFLGLSSSALLVLPYSWAQVSGEVGNQQSSITRSGLADMRMRFSVLLFGAPPVTWEEAIKNAKAKRKTIVGASINVVAPSGEFIKGKLVNLGANRWAFRPEIGISQPVGKRFLVDFYSGLWLFTNNSSFYPGTSVRRQDPMFAFQWHISYNIRPVLWVAVNATYYVGGQSSIDKELKDDRQSNARIGFTAVVPTGRLSSLRFSANTGAVVRIGQDFTTLSLGWQKSWIGIHKMKPAPPQ